MLKHIGTQRSFSHNLRLAILLSSNAGFINAAGFLAFAVLTTNVTGHAALLAVDLATGDLKGTLIIGIWLLLFLAGAFLSAAYIRKTGAHKPYAYTVPIAAIIIILLLVIVIGQQNEHTPIQAEYFAGSLLFAMGMQNALVSMISGSVVRTTHLTGMFTDLGIELSSAVLAKGPLDLTLKRKLLLHSAIILFFLLGGIGGGFLFIRYSYQAFGIPVFLLLIALLGDYFHSPIQRIMEQLKKSRKRS